MCVYVGGKVIRCHSLGVNHFDFIKTHYVCTCVGVCALLCACGGQKITCESRLFLSTTCYWELNSDRQDGCQAPLPAKITYWPHL